MEKDMFLVDNIKKQLFITNKLSCIINLYWYIEFKWINEWMNEWINKWMCEWMNEFMNE